MHLCVLSKNNKKRLIQGQSRQRNKYSTEYKKNPGGGEARYSAPVHKGPGAHPGSYTMGTGSLALG